MADRLLLKPETLANISAVCFGRDKTGFGLKHGVGALDGKRRVEHGAIYGFSSAGFGVFAGPTGRCRPPAASRDVSNGCSTSAAGHAGRQGEEARPKPATTSPLRRGRRYAGSAVATSRGRRRRPTSRRRGLAVVDGRGFRARLRERTTVGG